MATITAALNVNSDISSYGLTISNTMTMTKAGTNNGLERTSGLQRKHLTTLNEVDLLQGAAGTSAKGDVAVQPSVATTADEAIVEYMVFFD